MAAAPDRRILISLVWVDAAALGGWLWVLNRIVFHHPLVWGDYAWVVGLAVAAAALTRRYSAAPSRPLRAVLQTVAGQLFLVAGLCFLRSAGALHLSPRQIFKLAALQLPLLGLLRWLDRRCSRSQPGTLFETTRLLIATTAGVVLASVFVTDGWVGIGDAYWYDNVLADFVSQWRAGIFPAFVGQSEFAFNGAVSPVRFAPYFQHFAGVLDLVTCHALGFYALQNLTLVLATVGGGLSAYLCGAAILPERRWTASGLALLYIGSPGAMAMLYTGNLFMSVMTLPYLPLAVYGLWRWWGRSENPEGGNILTEAAWLALPLAATWWCHPPIALWLTALVAPVVGLRLACHWRDRRLWLTAATAAGLFALAAGYVFVSVAVLATPPTPAIDRTAIIGSIEAALPGSFLPVSSSVIKISDYQLGWSLWLVILFAALVCALRPRRRLGVMLGAIALLLLFLLPVPGVNRWLWLRALPQVVCDITFSWAAQRFYAILAAFAMIAGAAAVAAKTPRSIWTRVALAVGLSAGLAWTGREAVKFVQHGATAVETDAVAGLTHGRGNLFLTRYSFNIFLPVPAYFSHGYIDPYLENRILGADGRTVLASNLASARPPDSWPSIPLTADYSTTYHYAPLAPAITLAPGVRYAARIKFRFPVQPGALVAQGARTLRQYAMPDSGYGMIRNVPTHAYGALPTSSDFFPLWNEGPLRDASGLAYAYNDPAPAEVAKDFGRLYLKPYAVEDLPIKITAWLPYQATTRVSAEGAWLETPRMYFPGYAARVNGQPAALLRSPDGLVAVALVAGENEVRLSYPGPWTLQAAYWIALLTWAAAALAIAYRYLGGNPSRCSIT
jgi:hypothetical protein